MDEQHKKEYRRSVEESASEVTLTLSMEFSSSELTIEYKPNRYELTKEGEEYIKEHVGRIEPFTSMVEKLYVKLIDILYPGYEARDQPWEHAPMLVMFEWEGVYVDGTASLGSMH